MRIRFSALGVLLLAILGLTGCRGTADPWGNVSKNMILYEVAFGNGVFVALGNVGEIGAAVPRIETSTDGISWKVQQSKDVATQRNFTFGHIAYGNGGFVASDAVNDLFASRDGTNWTAVTPQPLEIYVGAYLSEIDWDGGEYVIPVFSAAGPWAVFTSADGIAWTGKTTTRGVSVGGSGSFVQVAGTWYAVDNNRNIASSTDLINWTEVSIPFASYRIYKLIYVKNQFIAVGSGGLIAQSNDGMHWADLSDPTVNGQNLHGIAWNGSVYVAFGDKSVLWSQDAHTWQQVDISNLVPSVSFLSSIAAAPNGAFVILGSVPQGIQVGTVDITSLDGVNWSAGHP